jgi:hypothetical protein
MTDRLRRAGVLLSASTLMSVAGCGTEEIQPNHVVVATAAGGPDRGALVVTLADAPDPSSPSPSNQAGFDVRLDGELIAPYPCLDNTPFHVTHGGTSGVRFLDAGPRHFTVVAPRGSAIFEADGQVPGGGTARLFLFGRLDALAGRFAATPDVPSAGNEHVTVVNLIPDQAIEVVSCADATTCYPISPALALGDVFDAELPAVVSDDRRRSLDARGAGVGYRAVASASAPAPTVFALSVDPFVLTSSNPPPAVFVAAPRSLDEAAP